MLFRDPFFESQWLRTVGHSAVEAAEIGECLAAADQIREPDPESWHRAWFALAGRLHAQADDCSQAGRRVSARNCYLRASNYYRNSYIFLLGTPKDARVVESYQLQRQTFQAALGFLTFQAEPITIPYGDTTLHGYRFRPSQQAGPFPTLIINGGYDSTAEESYFFSGRAALERGYACITFDGPGQGGAIVEKGLPFRADWENVIGPVIDRVWSMPEVDRNKIALMGISFGGYLAPRAASGQPRLAACIADPGEFSLFEEMKSRLPAVLARRISHGDSPVLRLFDWILRRRLRQPTAGWTLRRGMWVHQVKSPLEYLRLLSDYSLEGRVEQIRCPTLICSAEKDEIGVTAPMLFEKLTCTKAFQRFTANEGAGIHCEGGARSVFNQRAFDWLDSVLSK